MILDPLPSSTTSTERLAYTINRLHAQHQAQLAQADPIAVRHSATQPTILTNRQHLARRDQVSSLSECPIQAIGRLIEHYRALARADDTLAQRLDAL